MLFAAIAAAVLMLAGVPAQAATAAGPGNDVSWPQCGKALPKGQTFGIVGVNNGLANNTNPCLKTQLTWAGTSGAAPASRWWPST